MVLCSFGIIFTPYNGIKMDPYCLNKMIKKSYLIPPGLVELVQVSEQDILVVYAVHQGLDGREVRGAGRPDAEGLEQSCPVEQVQLLGQHTVALGGHSL